MKYIWLGILLFVVLISSVLGFKYFSSDYKYEGSASVSINASGDEVYRHIAVVDNWLTWSQFNTKNTPDILAVGNGVDRHLEWNDPRGGKAQMFLTDVNASERKVEFQVLTPTFPPMNGVVQVEAGENKDRSPALPVVTFSANGELPKSIFYAVASNGYGEMLSSQFQAGLDRLKKKLELEAKVQEKLDQDKKAEEKSPSN